MKSAVQSERGRGREGGGVVGARARTHAIRGGKGGGDENTVVSFHFKETVTVK